MRILVSGTGAKADVLLVDAGGGRSVVKDYAKRGALARWLGRLQLRRELSAYRRLEGVAGIPLLAGRIDAHALAIEAIEGEQLAFAAPAPAEAASLLAELRSILDAMHARGVVHNDLRGRENVLLRRDGGLAVIDFAAAMHLSPGGFPHRMLFRFLALADEAAYLKWKGMLAPGSYTRQDEAFLRRFERWRALWPFNPKRRKAGPKAA